MNYNIVNMRYDKYCLSILFARFYDDGFEALLLTPPAERCELCGAHPVEFEIKTDNGDALRRCPACFEEARRTFTKIRWVEVNGGPGETHT
jgi:hypothetical protein